MPHIHPHVWTVSAANARALYDAMEKFAGYEFNISHSVPYEYLGYLTAI